MRDLPKDSGTGLMRSKEPSKNTVASRVEQIFWEKGTIPSVEALARFFQAEVEYIQKIMDSEPVKKYLRERGLPVDFVQDTEVLDPKQLMLVNMIVNIYDKSTLRQKLEQLDLKPQQFNAWMKQPAFYEYLRKRAEALYTEQDANAFIKLAQAVDGGDLNALKFFFEMRGIYNPKLTIDVNVEVVMNRIVEVLLKYVDGPTMEKMADELDQILNETRSNLPGSQKVLEGRVV